MQRFNYLNLNLEVSSINTSLKNNLRLFSLVVFVTFRGYKLQLLTIKKPTLIPLPQLVPGIHREKRQK